MECTTNNTAEQIPHTVEWLGYRLPVPPGVDTSKMFLIEYSPDAPPPHWQVCPNQPGVTQGPPTLEQELGMRMNALLA